MGEVQEGVPDAVARTGGEVTPASADKPRCLNYNYDA